MCRAGTLDLTSQKVCFTYIYVRFSTLEPVSGGTHLQFSTKQPRSDHRNRAWTPENPTTSAGTGYLNAAPPRKKSVRIPWPARPRKNPSGFLAGTAAKKYPSGSLAGPAGGSMFRTDFYYGGKSVGRIFQTDPEALPRSSTESHGSAGWKLN